MHPPEAALHHRYDLAESAICHDKIDLRAVFQAGDRCRAAERFALDAEEETTKAQEEAAWNGIVTVALDLDGDGQVPVLVPVSGKDFVSSGGDVEKIPASAAAWVSRKDGRRTKICKSW